MSQASDIIDKIREDPRVDIVTESFVAQRLGCTTDDLPEGLVDQVLEMPMVRGAYVVAAKRLLDRLDAMAARLTASGSGSISSYWTPEKITNEAVAEWQARQSEALGTEADEMIRRGRDA